MFQGPFVPISLLPIFRIRAARILGEPYVQYGHQVVNFSTWWSAIYKTAHSIGLRMLSIALEKELKVLDCV